jgi:hypothetical protein
MEVLRTPRHGVTAVIQRKSRYQNGSISKIKRANGFVWKVRFSAVSAGVNMSVVSSAIMTLIQGDAKA